MSDRLDDTLQNLCDKLANRVWKASLRHGGWKDFDLKQEAKLALQAYIDSKIIEARIDELKELQMSSSITDADKDVLWEDYIQYRIKALNHRKDKDE